MACKGCKSREDLIAEAKNLDKDELLKRYIQSESAKSLLLNKFLKQSKNLDGDLDEPNKVNNIKINRYISNIKDKNDHARLRQGRNRYNGFNIGSFIQSPPMVFTRDGHSLYIADMFRGRPAFLIAGGPSFLTIDKEQLSQAGVLTMSMNNAVKTFRSNLWISVDDPTHFIKSIWLDPKIMKFVPFCHAEKFIFDNETWETTDTKVGDCPNVWFYRRNERFQPDQFLFEDTFNWGNHKDFGGGRSIMLPALRMLFYLGARTVFLLGVDFAMDKDNKYHFDQNRSKNSIDGNIATYDKLIKRFEILKPIFEENNFNVFNCNPNSYLKVFPFIDYNEAIKICTAEMPIDLIGERTEGLYDRK